MAPYYSRILTLATKSVHKVAVPFSQGLARYVLVSGTLAWPERGLHAFPDCGPGGELPAFAAAEEAELRQHAPPNGAPGRDGGEKPACIAAGTRERGQPVQVPLARDKRPGRSGGGKPSSRFIVFAFRYWYKAVS
jgi:hypothetical protein